MKKLLFILFNPITWVVIIGLMAVCVVIPSDLKRAVEREHKSYAAWVKYTGNSNALTFDEWLALTRGTHIR